ncbi:uncharacterized protein LOC128156479 [Crassostrea angulata]|uniref:uncharacterized protein n=1 Tax=Magallana gigas TaxID=29159 RepID=UPI00148A7246|nr:uncharacterized protein LOC105329703 [Crassostrea gigas]XP_052674607.1 uncharacterized protein LOC128156479 [Crassostrea angulata]
MKHCTSTSTCIFTLLWILPMNNVAEYLETAFSRVPSMSNKMATSNMLWQISGSKFACLAACATDARCVSCFLDGQSYCSGHSMIYRPTSSLQDSQGLWYYEVEDPASKLGCVAVPGETGYCVKLNVNKLSWSDQVTACEAENMRVASLTLDSRVTFVQQYLLGIGHAQATTIGAQLVSGTWTWISGDILSFASPHWGPGEPTSGPGEDCVIMAYGINYQLNDGQCGTLKSFLCDMYFVAN